MPDSGPSSAVTPRPVRLSPAVQALLRCPVCHSAVGPVGATVDCLNAACGIRFPVVDGIPVLINEKNSVFGFDDFKSHRDTFFNTMSLNPVKALVRKLTPSISRNIKGAKNYAQLRDLLLARSSSPRVLVIGGSILGEGMDALANHPSIELVASDVAFGPYTALITDAHDVPFQDESFDGVIVQAVLEHVVDPQRCCDEVFRVLKADGLVYAETPFMQQVHGGRYDFTRFTHLGHRRLFRRFSEVDSGAVCGPGMALAWSWQYFLMSFARTSTPRNVLQLFARITGAPLKYLDKYLIDTPATLDAASGIYFIGRKSTEVLSDRDLVRQYRGAF